MAGPDPSQTLQTVFAPMIPLVESLCKSILFLSFLSSWVLGWGVGPPPRVDAQSAPVPVAVPPPVPAHPPLWPTPSDPRAPPPLPTASLSPPFTVLGHPTAPPPHSHSLILSTYPPHRSFPHRPPRIAPPGTSAVVSRSIYHRLLGSLTRSYPPWRPSSGPSTPRPPPPI